MVKNGHVPIGPKPLYGYKWKCDAPGDDKYLVIDEKEATIIRWIAEQYDSEVSVNAIYKQLLELFNRIQARKATFTTIPLFLHTALFARSAIRQRVAALSARGSRLAREE
jgi:hypothetical protein